jgi:hypothetical protein
MPIKLYAHYQGETKLYFHWEGFTRLDNATVFLIHRELHSQAAVLLGGDLPDYEVASLVFSVLRRLESSSESVFLYLKYKDEEIKLHSSIVVGKAATRKTRFERMLA